MTQRLGAELVLEDSGFSSKISSATDKVKIFEKTTNQGGKAVDGVSKKMSSGISTVRNYIGAYLGIRSIISIYKDWTAASKDASSQETKLRAIMANTKGNTEAGAQAIIDYSSAVQNQGVVGDEVLLSGAQMAATFQLNEKTLKRLLPAMGDLIAQQKGYNATTEDGKTIGLLLGKAMTGQSMALKRVGINFTEAQEKVLKYGNEQQKLATLLDVIKANVGGVNKALAESPEGKIQQTKNAWGDLTEVMGAKFIASTAPTASFLMNRLPQIQEYLGKSIDFVIQTGSNLVDFFSTELYPRLSEIGSGLYSIYSTYLPNTGDGFSLLGNIISTTLTTALDIINGVVGAVVKYKDAIQIAAVGLGSYKIAQEVHVLWLQRQVIWTGILAVKTKALALTTLGAYGTFALLAMGAYSIIQVYQQMSDVTTEAGQDFAVFTSGVDGATAVLKKFIGFLKYAFLSVGDFFDRLAGGKGNTADLWMNRVGHKYIEDVDKLGAENKIGRYNPDFIKSQQKDAESQIKDGENKIKKMIQNANLDLGKIDMNMNAPDKNAKDKINVLGGATKFSSAFAMDGISAPSDYSISSKKITEKAMPEYSKAESVALSRSSGGIIQHNNFNFYDVGQKSIDELLSEFVPEFKKVCQNMG